MPFASAGLRFIPGNRVFSPEFRKQTGGCGRTSRPLVAPTLESKLFDSRFRLQQDGNAVANGIHSLALVALQGVFTAHHERLAANGAGEDFQQVRANHGCDFSKRRPCVVILTATVLRSTIIEAPKWGSASASGQLVPRG